jgi:hypothetical protein
VNECILGSEQEENIHVKKIPWTMINKKGKIHEREGQKRNNKRHESASKITETKRKVLNKNVCSLSLSLDLYVSVRV